MFALLPGELLQSAKRDIRARLPDALAANGASNRLSDAVCLCLISRVSSHDFGDAARYLVLESFDMLRGSLDEFLSRYYAAEPTANLLMYGSALPALLENLRAIVAAAPKGVVVDVAHDLAPGVELDHAVPRLRLLSSIDPGRKAAVSAALEALAPYGNAGWYLLAYLWDYVTEAPQ